MDYSKTQYPQHFWEAIHEQADGRNSGLVPNEDGTFTVCFTKNGRVDEEYRVDADGNRIED